MFKNKSIIIFILGVFVMLNSCSNNIVTPSSSGYDEKFINLVELLYGQDFLSQGGVESIDTMFSQTNLEGKKILDLGSGLGAMEFHLASKYKIEIVGVDPELSLIDRSNKKLKSKQNNLLGKVKFELLKNHLSLKQFPDNSFDIVVSKESLLHVKNEDKPAYFKEIYRVLKPSGKLIIMDWMHSSPNYSLDLKNMMEMDGITFNLMMPKEYIEIIANSNFRNINFIDKTTIYADLAMQDIEKIKFKQAQIEEMFGKETYQYSLTSWSAQAKAFRDREILAGILIADK